MENFVKNDGIGYDPLLGIESNEISNKLSEIVLDNKSINHLNSNNNIYNRNLIKKNNYINLSLFSYLYCEIVNFLYKKSNDICQLEHKLNVLGYQVGQRFLELVKLREGFKNEVRETKIIGILRFIHGPFWKYIFGQSADELEKSQEHSNEYMIIDKLPIVSKYVSVPKEYDNLNCSSFISGIIEGALDSSNFFANVTAYTDPINKYPLRTVFLIRFEDLVITREGIRYS